MLLHQILRSSKSACEVTQIVSLHFIFKSRLAEIKVANHHVGCHGITFFSSNDFATKYLKFDTLHLP